MNTQALLELADMLDAPLPRAFKWDFFTLAGFNEKTCGTVGCAIGLAVARGMLPGVNPASTEEEIRRGATEVFEIDGDHYRELFMDADNYKGAKIQPEQVARAIRKYVKNGKLPTYERPQG